MTSILRIEPFGENRRSPTLAFHRRSSLLQRYSGMLGAEYGVVASLNRPGSTRRRNPYTTISPPLNAIQSDIREVPQRSGRWRFNKPTSKSVCHILPTYGPATNVSAEWTPVR